MDYIWIILRRDVKSLLTPSGKSTLKQRMGLILTGLLLVALAVGFGYGAFRLFGFLATTLGIVPELRRAVEINVLNFAAMFVLIMVLLMGLQTTYKTIYESDDVGFLLSQPVPVSSVFGAKFITSYVSLFAITAGYGLPVWLAFGYAHKMGAGFYFLTVAGFLLLLLASHAIVTLLLLTAMRYLPGRKMKQLFVALSAVFGILFVFVSQMLSARVSRSGDTMGMIEELGKGQLSRMWYLPTTWMANGVLGTIPEFGIKPVGGWLALLVTAVGGAYLAMVLSSRWYLRGWSGRTEELGAGMVRRRRLKAGAMRASAKRLQGAYWSVLRKDLKTLWRDPMVWYTLAVGAIGLGFFVYNLGTTMGSTAGASGGHDYAMARAMMIVMPVLMGSITSAQTGGVSLSREGSSFWLVRSGPVSARELLLAKFTYAVLPQAAFVVVFSVVLEFLSLPHLPLWLGLLVSGFSVLGLASLQMLLDVYFPDFTLKIEFGSSKSGRGTAKLLIAMFSSMAMVALIGLTLSLPTILRARNVFLAVPIGTLSAWSYGVVAAVGVGLVALLFGPGTRRLSRVLRDM